MLPLLRFASDEQEHALREAIDAQADELGALRLMDYEGLCREESAECMGISRTTLSRTLAEARRKIADALLHGKRLLIARAPEMFSIDSQVAGASQSLTTAINNIDCLAPRLGGWQSSCFPSRGPAPASPGGFR